MTGYFSDRENGPRTRAEQVISPRGRPGILTCNISTERR